jgi:starch synthase
MMDFVFSEREDGGTYDNRFGMDYHIPVLGGVAKESSMHIVHIAVEMAPIAKVYIRISFLVILIPETLMIVQLKN